MTEQSALDRLLAEARPRYKTVKEEILDSAAQIDRLLSRAWHNPCEVLLVEPEAGDDELRVNFNFFRLSLHPDKCADSRAPEALAIVTQAHAALTDPQRRRIYQRVFKEAFDKTVHRRAEEARRRAKEGLPPLGDESFAADYRLVARALFEEIADKKAELIRADENIARRRREELDLLTLREEYRLQTEEEWDKTRDDRVKRWREFQRRAPRIGQRGANDAIKFAAEPTNPF